MHEVGVLWRPSLLSKGLILPKKLDLMRTPIAKMVAMLATTTFFHPCLKFFTIEFLTVVQTLAS
jgi:hypothetical protein